MNKVNFDGLKNIDVPEAWIANVLAVPEEHTKKPISFAVKYKRLLTSAACVLLVSIMSLPLYLFEQTEVSIPYISVTKSKENVSTEDSTNYSGTENTPCSGTQSPYFTDGFILGTTIDGENTFPTENIWISQNGIRPIPTAVPTQGVTEGISSVTNPSFTPTNPPIPTTQKPTKPMPTIPEPTKPVPTNTTPPRPTQPNTGAYVSMVPPCVGVFSSNNMRPDSGYMYCRLYDSFGNLVGDPDIYSSEHIANETPTSKGDVILSYDPMEKGLKLQKGKYSFCFYLKGGSVIFEGNITVF